jgi:hypothetical protein
MDKMLIKITKELNMGDKNISVDKPSPKPVGLIVTIEKSQPKKNNEIKKPTKKVKLVGKIIVQ